MNDSYLQNLDSALSAVSLFPSEMACPQGFYAVDLLLAYALVEPRRLLSDERALVELLRENPAFVQVVQENNPGLLGLHLLKQYFSHDEALTYKLAAALLTLRRANLLTMQTVGELLPDVLPPEAKDISFSYETAVMRARDGFLSLIDINLDPDPESIYKVAENEAL